LINLPGYQIKEEIFKSNQSTIFHGTRDTDNRPIVVKLLNHEYPSAKELSGFLREYEITDKLIGDGIINVYTLEKYNNSLAIIMEDFGGESITKALKSLKLSLVEKLSLAIQMTNSLIQTHQQNIIHKDVNPTNFVWNLKTNIVKIIDFGISTELTREASQCINLNILEGTLDYISPEQTGRMNRPIDYRTDLYSLGVTFYELFTGLLPFEGEDELEIVYCHIAKTPISPIDKNPEIPEILSEIVMKLMSKAAEERYQSALGLKKDLEYCRKELQSKRDIARFVLGQADIIDRFQIPPKLYGREEEIGVLVDGFEKIAQGHSEFLVVSGYSGIGKSSLIHEIRKPIAGKKGYFTSGKFDQLERNIPYYAITQAFRALIRQLLAESQPKLNHWRRLLLEAMGSSAQVIVDLIPELEQIIGPQPPLIELNPIEAQNRFQMTFRVFIRVFAGKEHPLVVFLDDLQWSDVSTLDLLKYLLGTSEVPYTLFIGAYRDNEVKAGHPLLQFIEELKSGHGDSTPAFGQLVLKPLKIADLNQLIADTFRSQPDITESLTKLIFQKTKGNPFFTNQVLNTLYHQGAFTFLVDQGRWEWDLKKVEEVQISDNVVDLLVTGLKLLPPETLELLKLAACIGNQFDLVTIASICEKSVEALGKDLWIAIEKEIVFPLNHNYRLINIQKHELISPTLEMRFCFMHDRIRQAVYSLIPQSERSEVHLRIGREYLKDFKETERMDSIFDLVNHLNIGRVLIREKEERIELSDLNCIAGNKAKKSTAFVAASSYFETAKSLLSEEEWTSTPEKLFALSLEHATAALLSGDLLKANEVCENISKTAVSNIDKGAISNIKVLILEFQAKLFEAIDEIRKSLLLFNISLPESAEEIGRKTQEGIMKMQQFLAQTPIEEFVNLPEMKDPDKLMAMQLLFQVVPPALQTNPQLYILASLMMFDLTVTYGTSPLACKCFGDCGVIQGTMLADYKTGYKLGEAAFALINKFKAESLKPPVYFIFTYISHWRAHYKESLDYYDMSYRTGLETGDLFHATYALAHKVHLLMWVGKNLTECKIETENAIAFLKNAKNASPLPLAEIVFHAIQKFQTIPEQGEERDFEAKDQEMMSAIEKTQNLVFLGRFFHYNTYINIIHDELEAAEKWNMMYEKIIFAGLSDFPVPDHYLFQALILIHKWHKAPAEEQLQIKETLQNIQQRLKLWADNCPANFLHKYYLLSAEMAILENESLETITNLFKKAIDSIGHDDFIQMRALCNELQGKFWLDKGNETIGKAYIREAYYLYQQWGAHRKVALLEKQYSQYFMTHDESHRRTKETHTTTYSSIDMTAILKSTQAISSEIKIEKLLTILIRTIIENAGAQQGCLLLKNEADNELYIEAMQSISSEKIEVMQSLLYTESKDLCPEIVQYVARIREDIVLNDACSEGNFQNNPYILKNRIKSVLCMPVIFQNRLKGVVYLENNLSDNVFTSERLEILKILSSQASISIDNARLYENMEEKIRERTVQLKNANEKLKEISFHDPLTNLHNRRYTFEFISDITTKFIKNKIRALNNDDKRELSPKANVIGVFLIDIDHFKEVNDTYGHFAGDNVLITLSEVLKKMVRADDFIVRWGGEEFLIVLNNTKPEYLKIFSRKVLETIKETPLKVSDHQTIYKTCSLGYVKMPLDISNPELLTLEQMINLSDYALYCAKENGRNCAAHFKLKRLVGRDDDFKKDLINLSKNSKVNKEYFKVEFIKP
jgi:diguanylate cyclase (GGDEF)-like protein